MTISIELGADEVVQLKEFTKLDSDATAVSHAVREYLRLQRLRELKRACGKVDFEDNWHELELVEIRELEG